SMSVTKNGETKVMTAAPGEEIVIADESLSDEELIPTDGVDREPIAGAVAVAGMKVQKHKFDRKMMAQREQLLLCNTGCFTISIRRKLDDMKQDMGSTNPVNTS